MTCVLARLLVIVITVAGAAGLGPVAAARAEDSDRPRFYLGFRGQDTNPLTDVHDAWGFSLGGNLNRYFGLELAGDTYELDFEPSGYGKVGEYAVFALIPQVRLRYPLFKDRLVPYVVGGVGGAFTEFSDRKPKGFGLSIDTPSTVVIGSVGAGIEYYIADNVAVGFEVKYLISGDQTIKVQGVSQKMNVNAPLTMLSLRMLYPELRPQAIEPAYADTAARIYLGLRGGGAVTVGSPIDSGLKIEPEPSAYGGEVNQLFGFLLGADFGRHFGAELSAEGFETRLSVPGLGSIREFSLYSLIPQARLRYPLLNGALVPYAVGGVGMNYGESNDEKPHGANVSVSAGNFGVSATLGVGLEYFVAKNIAVNFESRYLFARGQKITVDGVDHKGSLDQVLLSAGLRLYVYDVKTTR